MSQCTLERTFAQANQCMTQTEKHILLVDDHALVTDGIRALIGNEAGIHIVGEARNGHEALKMLRLLRIDLVLMDIDMPELNGIETAKIIRKENLDKKIIMLTMHDEKAMIRQLQDIGVDGYLLKNSSRAELLKAIDAVFRNETYFGEAVQAVLLKEEDTSDNRALSELTEREIEIIRLIADGLSNKEIGEKLFISHRTVDTHRTNLMTKLGLHNVAGIVRFAIQHKLINE